MDAKKRIEFGDIKLDIDISELRAKANESFLAEEFVDKGEIITQQIFKSANCEVTLLALSPGARIKEHWHINDSEWYIFFEAKKIECCPKGESHSLENPSTTEYLFVLSIKYK